MREWAAADCARSVAAEELRPRWRSGAGPAEYLGDLSLTPSRRGSFLAIGRVLLSHHHSREHTGQCARRALCALVLISNLASLLLAGWFPAAAELLTTPAGF